MKIRHLPWMAIALGFAALAACDRKDQDQRTSAARDPGREQMAFPPDVRNDEDFANSAARANLAEIEAGRLAASKGGDDDVRKFGRQMVDDHGQAQVKLTDLGAKKGFRLPTETDDARRQDLSKLSQLSGADLDQKFAEMMVADHEKAVALFGKNATGAKDGDVRDFAKSTLPTLQHHLKVAQELKNKVGESTAD